MKLRSAIVLMACLYTGTGATAQSITISLHQAPLRSAFDSIEKKTIYTFTYSGRILAYARPVSFQAHEASIGEVLALCFKNQPLSYSIVDSFIVVKVKDEVLAPPAKLNGTVLNGLEEPVEGITVRWKGSGRYAITDGRGFFSLPDTGHGMALVFSGVNIETTTLPVLREAGWKVHVRIKVSELGVLEFVNTGYQDIHARVSNGSFYKVGNELLNRQVSGNITERLQDVTSGLNVEPQNTGAADRSPVMIRGISTIHANMAPLVVLDNFPFNGDINNINPNDIESITVLKDAVAASIWGVQAGNGVIVIVTKKGRLGQRPRARLTSAVTVGTKPDVYYFPVIPAPAYAALEQRLFDKGFYNTLIDDAVNYPALSQGVEIMLKQRNGQLTAADAARQLDGLQQYDVRGDIRRYFVQNKVSQQYAGSVSGGTDKFGYYCSLGYDRNTGSNVGERYRRLTVRSDNTWRPLAGLELNGYIVYTNTDTRPPGISYTGLLPTGVGEQLAPYTRLADGAGKALAIPQNYRNEYIDTVGAPGLLDWHYRPLDELGYSDERYRQWNTRLGATVKYNAPAGITAELKYQYEKGITNSRAYSSLQTWYTRNLVNQYMYTNAQGSFYPVPAGGIADFGVSELDAWNLRGQLGYKRSIGKNSLVAFAGAEIREVNTDVSMSRKYGYQPSANTFSRNIDYSTKYQLRPSGEAAVPDNDVLSGTLRRYISYFSRVEYLVKNRYSFSAGGRVDESNFFGVEANQRRVPLWSAGVGWELSNESFYAIEWLPYLRLRATYGYNGNTNNNATAFATIQYLSPGASSLIPAPYSRIVSPPNPQLRWEKIRIVNLGVDFGVKSGRISGSIEYYRKQGLDLISQVSVDPTTGFTSYTGNNASISGNGIDMVLNGSAESAAFKWTGNLLLSYTTDRVSSYQQVGTVFDYVSGAKAPMVGRPLFSLYSYRWAGLNPVNGDPQAYLGKTVTGYSTIIRKAVPADLVYGGPLLPRVFGSLRQTFSWKSLSLSLNITYKLGYYFRRSSINYLNLLNNWGGHSDYLLRWQKPGDEAVTDVPSMAEVTGRSRDQVYLYSDILSERADHIRWRDLRLSYDINPRARGKLPAQRVQLYVYINNICILWKANKYGIDPDYGSWLIPAPRSIAAGVVIDF